MPNLLNFLKGNGTLLTNDHTILISHTAGGILSSLTGLYPDRNGQTVSNSYDYYRSDGTPTFTSSFKYWTDTVDGSDDSLPNMVGDGGQTAARPVADVHARRLQRRRRLGREHRAREQQRGRVHVALGGVRSPARPTSRSGRRRELLARPGDHDRHRRPARDRDRRDRRHRAARPAPGVTLTAGLDERTRLGRARLRARPGRRHDEGVRRRLARVERGTRLAARRVRNSRTCARADRLRRLRDPLRRRVLRPVRATPTRGRTTRRPSPARTTATSALFGAKYVDPAITNNQPCVKTVDGTTTSPTRSTSAASRASTRPRGQNSLGDGRRDAGARHPGHLRLHLRRSRQPHADACVGPG